MSLDRVRDGEVGVDRVSQEYVAETKKVPRCFRDRSNMLVNKNGVRQNYNFRQEILLSGSLASLASEPPKQSHGLNSTLRQNTQSFCLCFLVFVFFPPRCLRKLSLAS